ncbi:MAG: DUF2304 domain-containing protein [Candidatus Moranbacteria bacterium]|nr:DUF2304 domain-containing protein [Candidatus Moranbacteria bacterium]
MKDFIPGISIYRLILGIVSVGFLVEQLYRIIRRNDHTSFPRQLGIVLVWAGILLFSFFPDTARIISLRLGLGQNLNTLIFSGFVIVFLILFKLIDKIERIDRNLTELIRKEALEKLKK